MSRARHIIRWYQCFFMWVPSHVWLAGNSAADIAAKAGQLLPVSNLTIPHSDYNSLIWTRALEKWQLHCDSETQNKLHVIELRVNLMNLCRLPWDEITIHRLRIGHTYLTHGHLLRGETRPRCLPCHVELTVEHILLHFLSCYKCSWWYFLSYFDFISELFSNTNQFY